MLRTCESCTHTPKYINLHCIPTRSAQQHVENLHSSLNCSIGVSSRKSTYPPLPSLELFYVFTSFLTVGFCAYCYMAHVFFHSRDCRRSDDRGFPSSKLLLLIIPTTSLPILAHGNLHEAPESLLVVAHCHIS